MQDYTLFCGLIEGLNQHYFSFMTLDEIEREKRALLHECANDFSFKILTKIEAEIKKDFVQAVASKKRVQLSRDYIMVTRQYRKGSERLSVSAKKVRLEDIIVAIRDYLRTRGVSYHRDFSLLKGYFTEFRNWYAHGRLSNYPSQFPDPDDLEYIYQQLDNIVFSR